MNQQTINNQNIFAIIINFFTADNWQFQQIESEPILQMAFQGKHGRWNCYAQYKVEQHQFIFYSVSTSTQGTIKILDPRHINQLQAKKLQLST